MPKLEIRLFRVLLLGVIRLFWVLGLLAAFGQTKLGHSFSLAHTALFWYQRCLQFLPRNSHSLIRFGFVVHNNQERPLMCKTLWQFQEPEQIIMKNIMKNKTCKLQENL